MNVNLEEVDRIKQSINGCKLCEGFRTKGICIDQKEIGLNYIYHNQTPINILFVAESPSQPGNGFFYDQSFQNSVFRDRFFGYINESGLGPVYSLTDFNNKGYYLADAINCRWDKNKQSISKRVAKTCAAYLADQINLFRPRFIVFMGEIASSTLKRIEVFEAIRKNQSLEGIVEMSFILTTSKETKQERIGKLKKLAKRL